jgi:glycosyltransferase involved in cell wall biosynthesis
MRDSDLLLLFQNSPKYNMQVPAKTYEYMASGKWILTVAPPGATTELVAPLPNNIVVEPKDHAGMKAAILRLYDLFLQGRLYPVPRNVEMVRRFDRRNQCRDLAVWFNELAARGAA